jgi:methionyl aminopeptidase
MSLIKSTEQIALMREGGLILAQVLNELRSMVQPGVVTWSLEEYFLAFCKAHDVIPACKGYTAGNRLPPYPTGLCLYINNETVHCHPKHESKLMDGDIVTIDTVLGYKGIFVDAAIALAVGNIDQTTKKFLTTVHEALLATEEQIKPQVRTGQLSHTMQRLVETNGYNVLRDYAGHGIGTSMHEEPEIPCFGDPAEGIKLQEGMTICVEALVSEGKPIVEYISEWEAVMADGKRYAQFEHTVLVTANGYEILTPWSV